MARYYFSPHRQASTPQLRSCTRRPTPAFDKGIDSGYYGIVKIATISQAKNQFSALIDRVRQGETILILDRDRPVARIEPVVSEGGTDPEGRLSRLERAGVLRRARGALVAKILKEAPPGPKKGGDILKVLLEERETGS